MLLAVSYASEHAKTALRTLPWYVLPPALLMTMIATFMNTVVAVAGKGANWDTLKDFAIMGAFAGGAIWLLRQFLRIIQLARYYAR